MLPSLGGGLLLQAHSRQTSSLLLELWMWLVTPEALLPRSPSSVWAPGLRSPPCWRREGGHPGRLARLSVRIKSRLELRSRGRPLLGALAASLSREQLPRRLGSREALRAGGARSCPHCMPNHCSWSAHWAASLSLPSRSPSSPLPSMSSTSSS